MFSRVNCLNPCRSKTSLYTPDGSEGNRYFPSASVTVVRLPINDGDVAVTVTPGSTAPCASLTVPLRRPCAIWANPGDAISTPNIANTTNHAVLDLIWLLPERARRCR